MNILVISHEASRSGAPILLLNFLQAYKKRRKDLKLDIIISRSGPLESEFRKISSRVLVLVNGKHTTNSPIRKIINKIANKAFSLFFHERSLKCKLGKFASKEYDLIFSNTITNGTILNALQPSKSKIISYVHELENTILGCTSAETLAYTLNYTSKFIVPSFAVRDNLINNHNVSPNDIASLNYYIPEVRVARHSSLIKNGNEFVVGCIGTLEWRKGADLFLQSVKLFKSRMLGIKVKFLWVGADKMSNFFREISHDIKVAGLTDDILLIEKVENPIDYIASMDVFLMLSREDPYPLVVLEAAMLKKPIICFDKAGGASEFLDNDNGIVVPYLDIEAVVEKLTELLFDENLRRSYGERARWAYMLKHSEHIAIRQFTELIDEYSYLCKDFKK